ncbi:12701_t:CDS:2 [Rhizophagus irregularis]|nr:12701_t:CDS:2 [Rhizophagus irregularis]
MIDVVHSVNLDQRLDFPHDQYFPNNTPATIATTTPVQASFGFDLPGELTQSTSCVNNFFEIPNWTLIAAMTFQLSDQDININNSPQSNVSTSQQQNSRQYNDMTATAFSNQHQYSHDSSVQQTSILPSPPFVEPSGNYIAISSATNNTQTLPYGYPSSTLPTSNTLTNNLDTGNHIGYNFNPNQCYQTSIPSSIGNNSQHHGNHQKSRSINNFSRQDATTNLPISIAPNLFMQQFNNQSSNGSTITSPIKQTYSYSGPPKSYYSRLPLYDRPFKCDQCPQTAQKDPFGRETLSLPIL